MMGQTDKYHQGYPYLMVTEAEAQRGQALISLYKITNYTQHLAFLTNIPEILSQNGNTKVFPRERRPHALCLMISIVSRWI